MTNYTHIIVGAGSAGCVLAEGLSAHPDHRVLLLEAGPDYVEDRWPTELENGTTPAIGSHDWDLWADIGDGRRVRVPRGRVVGGTSQINSCIALRPEPSDFDHPALGGLEWSWARMLACFQEVEDDLDFRRPIGERGPLQIRRPRHDELTFPSQALIDVAQAAGHPYVANHNAPFSTGVGPVPLNISDEGQRRSARLAFLERARGRGNLDVVGKATVGRVVTEDGRAQGVEYHDHATGARVSAVADRIVIAAGTYGTPIVLQRSGLGPRRLLESLDIPVVCDLPGVGANLNDHVQVALPFAYKGVGETTRTPCVQVVLRYTSGGSRAARNDMQICMINHVALNGYHPPSAAAWHTDVASSLTANLMLAHTRGTIALAGPDRDSAVIEYGFVDHPDDLARLREGVRAVCSILASEQFQQQLTHRHRPTDAQLADDDSLDLWIQENFQPGHHPVGTARIGHSDDPRAVVTDNLAVRGITGLYVADASVLPEPIRANTNLTVMALARNALRMLQADDARMVSRGSR